MTVFGAQPAPGQSLEQLMSSPQLRAALRRGVASEGEPSRLLRVLRDAEAGRAVTLVGIGASLTQDFAGVIGRDNVKDPSSSESDVVGWPTCHPTCRVGMDISSTGWPTATRSR